VGSNLTTIAPQRGGEEDQMEEKWWVRTVPRTENTAGYFRIENSAALEVLVVAISSGDEPGALFALMDDANRGAQEKTSDAAIDTALDAAMATTRQRTPAQSADGFLRDALVMLADRRYESSVRCGMAVAAIGKALKAVSCLVALEQLEVCTGEEPQEGGDAAARM